MACFFSNAFLGCKAWDVHASLPSSLAVRVSDMNLILPIRWTYVRLGFKTVYERERPGSRLVQDVAEVAWLWRCRSNDNF